MPAPCGRRRGNESPTGGASSPRTGTGRPRGVSPAGEFHKGLSISRPLSHPQREKGAASPGSMKEGLSLSPPRRVVFPVKTRIKVGSGLIRKLLAVFSTVEEVLASRSLFSRTHPSMYLVADHRGDRLDRGGPEGRFSVRSTASGMLTHTNHYLDETLIDANGKIGRSSRTRLIRIDELLKTAARPLTWRISSPSAGTATTGPTTASGGRGENRKGKGPWRVGSSPSHRRPRRRSSSAWPIPASRNGR